MKTLIALLSLFASIALLSTAALAASVDTRLSTNEAYVGVPITLQIVISNVSDYEPPAPPDIDGCEVRAAGAPSQSSQITIINGRRRESHSISLQYLITPRREGTYKIPALELQVDGETVKTQPQHFVATRSETGDLLYVAIEGRQDKVYVGQPIDLTLKIWIKPFHDPETGQTLSEGDMWNLLSESTSWGSFETRLNKLAQMRQRPGGREVLRDDARGEQKIYYLYEIEAVVYPKRAGKIDANDVQIVLNYPTEIGELRAPLGGLFDDDIFGNSPLSQMMRNDFFGSPFDKRLAITAARPVVGQASVEATDVLPIPSEGRPSDYRGAVGRYQIVTQATPTSVEAGDPITLNIGIVGTGAMELVQAPPLAKLPELTSDFQVADEALAGFVQDDSKLFSTTIRPRQAGTKQIPAIRFSFFDPETETFETVTSQPIRITVDKAEMLALDSIIGPTSRASSLLPNATQIGQPNLKNYSGADVLISQPPTQRPHLRWWLFMIVPPAICLATAIAWHYHRISGWMVNHLRNFQPPYKQCRAAIDRARNATAVRDAVVTYILRRLPSLPLAGNQEHQQLDRGTRASAALRTAGLYDLAGNTESWMGSLDYNSAEIESYVRGSAAEDHLSANTNRGKATAINLVDRLELAIAELKQCRLRVTPSRRKVRGPSRNSAVPHKTLTMLVLVGVLATTESGGSCLALAHTPVDSADSNVPLATAALTNNKYTTLTHGQLEILLTEADAAYGRGTLIANRQTVVSPTVVRSGVDNRTVEGDSAEAKEAFTTAAQKYQLLVDSGISNSKLFLNLGNAYLQSGSLGRAIANYERVRRLAPRNAQARENLAWAQAQVVRGPPTADGGESTAAFPWPERAAVSQWAISVLCLASLAFWGLLTVRVVCDRIAVFRYAAAALLLMLVAGGAVAWLRFGVAPQHPSAVIVASSVTLHNGDGEQFGVAATLEQAEGRQVAHLNARGAWTQIQTADGQVGWLRSRDVEVIP